MKKLYYILPVFMLAVLTACGNDDEGIPAWPWGNTTEEPEPTEEANPGIVALGWTNVGTTYGALPTYMNVYKSPSSLQDKKAIAYIAVADMNSAKFDVWGLSNIGDEGSTESLQTPTQIFQANNSAPIIINGGYFYASDGKNYNSSLLVKGSELSSPNINYASETWEEGGVYNPTRGAFIEQADGSFKTCWTYITWDKKHFMYPQPAANSWDSAPLDAPSATFPEGGETFAAKTAIGGGPVLVKGGEIKNTYVEEMFNGANTGIAPESNQPRTAIGITSGKKMILFVCEGREMTEGVAGLTTGDVAAILKELGCTEAMNLDGGGSSCMLVNGHKTIQPTDSGGERAVGSAVILK